MVRSIPGFGNDRIFSHKIIPYLQGKRDTIRRAKKAEIVIPKAERHVVRDMEEFAAVEEVVFARLRQELNGAEPILDYDIPHQQHYVVLLDERGMEVRARVLSQTTLAYDRAKETGSAGTLGK